MKYRNFGSSAATPQQIGNDMRVLLAVIRDGRISKRDRLDALDSLYGLITKVQSLRVITP